MRRLCRLLALWWRGPEVELPCVFCGTTAELASGDCAYCAGFQDGLAAQEPES